MTAMILAVAGSLREGSFNRLLLKAAVECAPPGMTIRFYDDMGSVPLFNEDLERATGGTGPEVVVRLRHFVAEASGLLIATPEYNQSAPGVLKNVIDWLSRPGPEEVLAGKPVAVIGASGGRWGTCLAQAAVRQALYATESVVLPRPALYVREAERVFDPRGHLVDVATQKQLQEVLTAFDKWIRLVGPSNAARAALTS